MSSAISKTETTSTTTLSAAELKKIELKYKILLLDDVLAELEDQALVLEGVSNALQSIINRRKLKRSSDECEYLIETVKRFSNDAFNHENEVFTCLQKEGSFNDYLNSFLYAHLVIFPYMGLLNYNIFLCVTL